MESVKIRVEEHGKGQRLDRFLAEAHPQLSRSEIQQQIRNGHVTINDKTVTRPSTRLRTDDEVAWSIPSRPLLQPAAMEHAIIYEDDHLVVVDKATDVVVHPGAGTKATTLVEGLLFDRTLGKSDDPARPGVVHRLDRETSGVIVFAKSAHALADLQRQFAARSVDKQYVAVVGGTFTEVEGMIEAPIARNPAQPQRMCVIAGGRAARTDFRVLNEWAGNTLVLAFPKTGRTHQIRVHFQYIHHPIVGDEKYGGAQADRLFLHAWRLQIDHPVSGRRMEFVADVPAEFPDFDYNGLLEKNAERR